MPDPDVEIRPARLDDADQVGDLWLGSFRATYPFPPGHPDDAVRRWLREAVLPRPETFVAVEPGGLIVGLMAMRDEDLDQLYVREGHHGRGIGSRLVELAKALRPNGLWLYTFQVNSHARTFYEKRGFQAVSFGTGEHNEEHEPDVRYAWRPEAG